MIQIDSERYWLYNAVDPETNDMLCMRLYNSRTTGSIELLLRELKRHHDVEDAAFLVDGGPWLHDALDRHGLDWQHITHGLRNSVERVYTEVKRRTSSFANTFSHVDPETAETWLLAHARWHNLRN